MATLETTVLLGPGTDETLDALEALTKVVVALQAGDGAAAATQLVVARVHIASAREKVAGRGRHPGDTIITFAFEGETSLDPANLAREVLTAFEREERRSKA